MRYFLGKVVGFIFGFFSAILAMFAFVGVWTCADIEQKAVAKMNDSEETFFETAKDAVSDKFAS